MRAWHTRCKGDAQTESPESVMTKKTAKKKTASKARRVQHKAAAKRPTPLAKTVKVRSTRRSPVAKAMNEVETSVVHLKQALVGEVERWVSEAFARLKSVAVSTGEHAEELLRVAPGRAKGASKRMWMLRA
jgi:hypothetical protein